MSSRTDTAPPNGVQHWFPRSPQDFLRKYEGKPAVTVDGTLIGTVTGANPHDRHKTYLQSVEIGDVVIDLARCAIIFCDDNIKIVPSD